MTWSRRQFLTGVGVLAAAQLGVWQDAWWRKR